MDRFDFSPLFRSTIGFERLTRLVDVRRHALTARPSRTPLTTSRRPAKTPTGWRWPWPGNGLLHVNVVREVPEAAKPRTIKIGTTFETVQPQVTEQKAA
jgi:hypothetical protein